MAELTDTDRQQAQRLRRKWMTLLGCDAAEIEEACAEPSCFSPPQEQIMMDAARRLAQETTESEHCERENCRS